MFPSRRIATSGGDVYRNQYSLQFDGSDSYVDCGDIDIGTGAISISCWAYVSTAGTQDGLVCKDHSNRCFLLQTGNSDADELSWIIFQNDSTYIWKVTDGNNFTANVWHHVVATSDGSGTMAIYIDGVSQTLTSSGSGDGTIQDTTFKTIIGAAADGTSKFFTGKIDSVGIWNTALSSNQVKTLYNNREPFNAKNIALSSLKAYYRMGDGVLDDKQTDGLVADQVTPTLGSEKFTAFANASSNSFDTFSASSTGFTAGADGSGAGAIVTNQLWTAEGGNVAKISFDIVINSGVNAKLYWADATSGGSGVGAIIKSGISTGSYTLYAIVGDGSDDADYLEFYKTSAHSTNITVSNFSAKILSGNAGVMVNFDGDDFKTDTH